MKAIFFDLDGTLIDTAPDLATALNALRLERGKPALPYLRIRDQVSRGGAALVRLGFGEELTEEVFEQHRQRLLEIYRQGLCVQSAPFAGMESILDYLQTKDLIWGIVTNKPAWLTDPLAQALGLSDRAACVISGDTTPHRKPHPAPLLLAAELVGVAPEHCVYLGDDPRDIQAGKAAGMKTLIAAWGYIDANEDLSAWGADGTLRAPTDLPQWLSAQTATDSDGELYPLRA